MDQLIIFLLVAVASIVSSIIQAKKKREEERRQQEQSGPAAPAPSPLERWPQSPGDWQEVLRRMLNPEQPPAAPRQPPPPPLPQATRAPTRRTETTRTPPALSEVSEGELVFDSPFKESAQESARAHFQDHVEARFRQIEEQPLAKRPKQSSIRRRGSATRIVQQWRRHPSSIRDAILASIILGPPAALQPEPQAPFGR